MGAAPHNHTRPASQCLVALSIASLLWAAHGLAAEPIEGPETKAKKKQTAKPAHPPFKDSHTGLRGIFLGDEGGETTVQVRPPKSPEHFNPDPGGNGGAAHTSATTDLPPPDPSPLFGPEPIMPREGPPSSLALPRRGVRGQTPINKVWEYSQYPLGREGLGFPQGFKGVPNRWFLNIPHWQRYMDPSHETPYMYDTPRLWHPYEQSTLKGDMPIIGEDIFMNLTAKSFTLLEKRKLPTPSGVSAAQSNASEFFGRSEQVLISTDTSLAIDIFEGETAFKPVTWLVRVLGVYNNNWLRVQENNVIDADPRGTIFEDNRSAPNGGKIQAIPSNGTDFNPKPGLPGKFTSDVNPGDVFNFLQPELNNVGNGKDPVPVDRNTNEPPTKGTKDKNRRENKDRNKDFAGTRYTDRYRNFFALQEAFAEIHIGDLSDNYDFLSSRWGIQPFVSDFRGFIYADTNLGARLFGNWDNNRWQYNLVYFNQREKDTYSDLNMFDSRHQQVLIANIFRQDFIWLGYTAQLSFHMNMDDGGTHYQKDDFLTRQSILGTVLDNNDPGSNGQLDPHEVKAYYFGWTGDGHIGRLNITHAFYQVVGEDEFNGLAGRRVSINAQMAALELSYDRDWIRFKLSGFYASGDSNPTDSTARGFDSILDNPFFVGGPFSWYVHQGFNLGGTGVNLKQRDSLIPDLRTSKTEGQSNFVNPGVFIVGLATDIDVTPKLKAFANANYIWFAETKPIETALQTNKARDELGLDLSLGFKFRPLLTDNIIVAAGLGTFFPGAGYRDIYRRNTQYVPGYGPQEQAGKVDRFLYNAFFTLTLLY
jgi:hypothetical protein